MADPIWGTYVWSENVFVNFRKQLIRYRQPQKPKKFSPKVLTRGFWGSLITNLASENENSEIQDGGAHMTEILSIKQLNKTYASVTDGKEYVWLIWKDLSDAFGCCDQEKWKFFVFLEKSQSIFALFYSGGNLGPGKLYPLCMRVLQMKKRTYIWFGKIWVIYSDAVIETSNNFSFFSQSHSFLALLFSSGNSGLGKLCPLCVWVKQFKKSTYNQFGKIWVMHSDAVIEKRDNFSFFFGKSQSILALKFFGVNLGPGKLCPLCTRVVQMKKNMYT